MVHVYSPEKETMTATTPLEGPPTVRLEARFFVYQNFRDFFFFFLDRLESFREKNLATLTCK